MIICNEDILDYLPFIDSLISLILSQVYLLIFFQMCWINILGQTIVCWMVYETFSFSAVKLQIDALMHAQEIRL